jgi:hypothetical protein
VNFIFFVLIDLRDENLLHFDVIFLFIMNRNKCNMGVKGFYVDFKFVLENENIDTGQYVD